MTPTTLSGTVHPCVLEAHPTICRWVLGHEVSTEKLERELRAAADEELTALDAFLTASKGKR